MSDKSGLIIIAILAIWVAWAISVSLILWRGCGQGRRIDRAFWLQRAQRYDELADELEENGGDVSWIRAQANHCRALGDEQWLKG